MGRNAVRAVTADQNAEIVDSFFVQQVQFPKKPLPIAAFTLRSEDGAIPEVGPYVAVGLSVEFKPVVLNGYERRT